MEKVKNKKRNKFIETLRAFWENESGEIGESGEDILQDSNLPENLIAEQIYAEEKKDSKKETTLFKIVKKAEEKTKKEKQEIKKEERKEQAREI